MKIGVFTVSVPDWQPEEALEKLSQLGYDGVEWRITEDEGDRSKPSFWSGNRNSQTSAELIERAASLKAAAKKFKMEMPSLGTYIDCSDLAKVDLSMRAAVAIGATGLRIGPGEFDTRRGSYGDQLAKAITQYKEVAKLAKKHNVRALIETHMGMLTPTVAAAMTILKDLDPRHVGIMWDPGNQVMEGGERTPMALQLAGEYLAEVHVKNMRFDRVQKSDGRIVYEPVSAPVDAGVVDWPQVVKELKAAGYNGWFFLEDFCEELPMEKRVKHNVEFFRKLIK